MLDLFTIIKTINFNNTSVTMVTIHYVFISFINNFVNDVAGFSSMEFALPNDIFQYKTSEKQVRSKSSSLK